MRTAIYENESKKNSALIFERITTALKGNSIEYYVAKKDFDCNTDFVIVIGGDGTILGISEECAKKGIPIVGINSGKVGFLTVGDENTDFDLLFKKIKSGEYNLENRTLLTIEYDGRGYLALNELTLTRGGNPSILTIDVLCNNQPLFSFSGDGICVSTPTGSTAYSLSAGGPIVKYDLEASILTPICAHSLSAKPIVLGGSDIVSLACDIEGDALLTIDGRLVGGLSRGERVVVAQAKEKISFISTSEQSFYSKIRVKLFS